MLPTAFDSIVPTLREELIEYYHASGERLGAASWHNTLETNSGFVARRADPLLLLFLRESGLPSVRGLRVLDVGCGFGALAVYFAAHGAIVEGIDPNGARLEVGRAVARRHDLPVGLATGSMERLDFPDRSFELVVMNNSLCYVVDTADRHSALTEALRVLRPGGRILIRNPNRAALLDQFTGLPVVHALPPRAADRTARMLGRRRSRVRLLTVGGARRELRRAGFVDVRSAATPSSSWPAAARRFARYQHLLAQRPQEAA